MLSGDTPVQYHRYSPQGWQVMDARVITEASVSLTVNGQEWLSFSCTPTQLEALAVGFLFNEDLIRNPAEVADVRVCERGDNVDVWLHHSIEKPKQWRRTSGCGGGITGVLQPRSASVTPSPFSISPDRILAGMELLFSAQEIYRQTRGIHCSVLSDGDRVIAQAEDIGRHNTLDKLAGLLLLQGIIPSAPLVLTTGRISSEMMQKSLRLGASVVVSRTAASSQAIALAEAAGVTLAGYARRNQMFVYTHPERLQDMEPVTPGLANNGHSRW